MEAGASIERARELAISELAAKQAAAPTVQHVAVTEDASDKRQACLEAALEARVGLREWDDQAKSERSMSLLDMARHQCERSGLSLSGMSKSEIAFRAMHSTSDFPLLLANVARKSLMAGYDAEESTWRPWPVSATCLIQAATEIEVAGQISRLWPKVNTAPPRSRKQNQTWKLDTYAKKIRVTRQLIVSDDLDAFRIPGMIGRGMTCLSQTRSGARSPATPPWVTTAPRCSTPTTTTWVQVSSAKLPSLTPVKPADSSPTWLAIA